ncbi:hypothetical protein FJTKL_13985 [Diaporthe vaccinii]|uniref:Uncharacterized protein n=1 Tax=Diaporthe vaccinii TaxID=105482 RepID=A0ABR4E9D4_9PEZI
MPNQGIISLCEAKKMGLTDFWKSSTDKRADEVRSGAVAPTRTERKRCWESRDAYFACLDRNNILDAIKDDKAAAKQCGGQSTAFERDCASEWVSKPLRTRTHGTVGRAGWLTGWLTVGVCFPRNIQVTYFKKWRVAEHNKKQRLAQLQAQGAQNVQIQSGPAGS